MKIDKSFNIHHKNIQSLAIEPYKVKNNLSNQIMQEIFEKRQNLDYNFRFRTDFVLPGVNTTYFGLHSLRYFSSKIWNVITDKIKTSLSLDESKIKIRQWAPSSCHYKLCRSCIQLVGYVNQKQPPRGVLKKRCSENIQQIYRRTPIPKCDFKVLL